MPPSRKPILCLDFDGVCTTYASGWQGIDTCRDPPVPGLEEFLEAAIGSFEIHIHSSRSSDPAGREAMELWFERWIRPDLLVHLYFPVDKPPAMVTLDDRAITFTGAWPQLELLRRFVPWTGHTPPPHEQPPGDDLPLFGGGAT